jgi:hypothetical protein
MVARAFGSIIDCEFENVVNIWIQSHDMHLEATLFLHTFYFHGVSTRKVQDLKSTIKHIDHKLTVLWAKGSNEAANDEDDRVPQDTALHAERRVLVEEYEEVSCRMFLHLHVAQQKNNITEKGQLKHFTHMVHLISWESRVEVQPIMVLALMHKVNPLCQHLFFVPDYLKQDCHTVIDELYRRAGLTPPSAHHTLLYSELAAFGGRHLRSKRPQSLLPSTLFRNFQEFRGRLRNLGPDAKVAANITGATEKAEAAILALAAASSGGEVMHLDFENWGSKEWCPTEVIKVQFKRLNATLNLQSAIQYEELRGTCDEQHFGVGLRLAARLDFERDGTVVKMYQGLCDLYHSLAILDMNQAEDAARKVHAIIKKEAMMEKMGKLDSPKVALADFPLKDRAVLEKMVSSHKRAIPELRNAVKLASTSSHGLQECMLEARAAAAKGGAALKATKKGEVANIAELRMYGARFSQHLRSADRTCSFRRCPRAPCMFFSTFNTIHCAHR